MTEQPTTRTLGNTTVVLRWVERDRAEQVIHASDGFQILLAITLAAAGAEAAAVVALATGLLHPIPMYLIVCGLGVATVVLGIVTFRDYTRLRKIRAQLDAATVQVPIPLTLATPAAAPTFTSYGLGQASPAQIQGIEPLPAPDRLAEPPGDSAARQ
jgi:hypothetical protein